MYGSVTYGSYLISNFEKTLCLYRCYTSDGFRVLLKRISLRFLNSGNKELVDIKGSAGSKLIKSLLKLDEEGSSLMYWVTVVSSKPAMILFVVKVINGQFLSAALEYKTAVNLLQ